MRPMRYGLPSEEVPVRDLHSGRFGLPVGDRMAGHGPEARKRPAPAVDNPETNMASWRCSGDTNSRSAPGRREDLAIEQFASKLGVEALAIAILSGAARLDEQRLYVVNHAQHSERPATLVRPCTNT
jgi:hypothetical protein